MKKDYFTRARYCGSFVFKNRNAKITNEASAIVGVVRVHEQILDSKISVNDVQAMKIPELVFDYQNCEVIL